MKYIIALALLGIASLITTVLFLMEIGYIKKPKTKYYEYNQNAFAPGLGILFYSIILYMILKFIN